MIFLKHISLAFAFFLLTGQVFAAHVLTPIRGTGGFSSSTKILSANNEWSNIGALIANQDMSSARLGQYAADIVGIFNHINAMALTITFHGVDDPITLAPDQAVLGISIEWGIPFWQTAKNLAVGDKISSLSNYQRTLQIQSIIPSQNHNICLMWTLEHQNFGVFIVGERAQIIATHASAEARSNQDWRDLISLIE